MIIPLFCPDCLERYQVVVCDGYDGPNLSTEEVVRSIRHADHRICISVISKRLMHLQLSVKEAQNQIRILVQHTKNQPEIDDYYPLLISMTEIPYNLEKEREV